ncbi:ABC transporter permease [Planotetraspora thailandica]|uniref:ABC transporter permease n=1 Tax=Planotetraspora thailandica TaxID=487172 RepID=A0A8J3VF47_9ACTN|nr:ABC-2 family transporter protein [Planotetraspora thailandica]GII57225.1 ABC transporter permease [Planotetraspora thailandica]
MRLIRYGFRRHATYWAAALAGAFTNTVFGILQAYVLIALWSTRPGLGGYDLADAVTFCFLAQAYIGPMQVFGGGLDLPERVRSGDVALDLARPASLQLWYLSEDLGRAAYLVIARSVPPTLVGALVFGIAPPAGPGTWAAFPVSVALAVLVSFGWRYLVALASFWVLDDRGLAIVSLIMTTFFSGLMLPLVIFPGWLGELARALPWAAMVQVPADVYLGTTSIGGALAFQAFWALVLLGLGAFVTAAARRKLVIQGG